MVPRLRIALVAVLALACGGNESPGQRLQHSVTTFNHAVRWDNLPIAQEFVPADERDAWLKRRRRIAERVTFLDYEIVEVRHIAMTATDAEVIVTLTWTPKTSNVVETTRVLQSWRYVEDEKRWELAKQVESKVDESGDPADDPDPF